MGKGENVEEEGNIFARKKTLLKYSKSLKLRGNEGKQDTR